MGITMGKNGARAPRTGTTLGTPQHRVSGGRIATWGVGVFGALWGLIVIAFWVVKVIAFFVFIFSLIGVLGALIKNNTPDGAQIAWTIGSFVAVWIL